MILRSQAMKINTSKQVKIHQLNWRIPSKQLEKIISSMLMVKMITWTEMTKTKMSTKIAVLWLRLSKKKTLMKTNFMILNFKLMKKLILNLRQSNQTTKKKTNRAKSQKKKNRKPKTKNHHKHRAFFKISKVWYLCLVDLQLKKGIRLIN